MGHVVQAKCLECGRNSRSATTAALLFTYLFTGWDRRIGVVGHRGPTGKGRCLVNLGARRNTQATSCLASVFRRQISGLQWRVARNILDSTPGPAITALTG